MIQPLIIGHAQLYLGDCAEVLPELGPLGPDGRGVSDFPYDFVASGGGKYRSKRKGLDQIQAADLDQGFDASVITAEQFPAFAGFCHNDQLPDLLPYFRRMKLLDTLSEDERSALPAYLKGQYHRVVVCNWHKDNPQPVCNKHYVPDTEPWIHAWNPGAEPVGEVKDLSRIWRGPNGKQDDYNHPTVKHVSNMRKIVRNVGGALICDPFMGTGTTGAAALIEGKRFIGIEKCPAFFAMAVDRIKRIYSGRLARIPLSEASP